MESLKKLRTPLRSGFSRIANQLEQCLENRNPDANEIELLMNQLNEKWYALDEKEKKIHELLADDPKCSQDTFDSEYNDYESYKEKYIRFKTQVAKILNSTVDSNKGVVSETVSNKRRFKLPKVELRKFSGEIKEWLGFWGQFKKIHEDVDIVPEDKFIYLCQSTVEGSRARELVDSFPPSAENYEHAIECLKTRFGREDLLIEVYVRELLSLVLSNSMSQKKTRLASLYDKIESHIRALNSMGVTSDKYASILYPLVESCLPEDIIRVWERNMTLKNEIDKESNKLTALMRFLKSEVEGEERISIAKEGFSFDSRQKAKPASLPHASGEGAKIPTAAGLFDATRSNICVFCEKKNHESSACRLALKMNLDDRKKILMKKGCCFCCLKVGHRIRHCKYRINCERCKGKHFTIMCNESKQRECDKLRIETNGENNAHIAINDTMLSNRTCSPDILLQTLYVRLRGKRGGKIIRCLIDSGSQRSYLSKRVAEEMHYDRLKEETVIHNLFGGKEHTEKHYRYRVLVSSIDEEYHCNFEVLDQGKICSKIPTLQLRPCSQELNERSIIMTDQLIAKDKESPDIDLLIGADVAGKLLNGKVVPLPCGLVAVGTHLGWTLMGKMPFDDSDDDSTMVVTNLFAKDIAITELWDLDIIGITDPIAKKDKKEKDLQMKMQFQNSVSINKEGRYEVALPWAEDHLPLPTNKDLALKRLGTATLKLQSQNLFRIYDEVFKNWQDLGIIEEVKQGENIDCGHYLPHRAVIKANSSTPVRPVFDASARTKLSPSLNQSLECGPNLIELIPSLLLRFREKMFGVVADIEKAFLQISIRPSDRHYLRFFWWQSENAKEVKVFQHTRVVFGVNSSPFLLGAVIDYHLQNCMEKTEYDQKAVEKLRQSFYVDNVLASLDSESELYNFIEESRKVMAQAKFNLRCWQYSNDTNPEVITNLLGLIWNREEDIIKLSLNWLEDQRIDKITKRIILALTHKVFDPVGLVSPVLLLPKLMLQGLWKSGISWDAEVDENTKERFLNWFRDLHLLREISIPRWIHYHEASQRFCSIHTFCDASGNAYAATVFLRVQTYVGVEVHLLASKSRVAPVKSITIPRLELIAAAVGARLCTSVVEGLQWQNVELTFWTDSTAVLSWIQKDEIWTVFVSNRVREIRKLTNPKAWRYIKGIENPADLPSRGCSAKQLLAIRWWEGPAWLKKNETEWPKSNLVFNQDEITREKRKGAVVNTQVNVETEEIFYRISSYPKLIRVIAWVYRFYLNLKSKNSRCIGNLTVKEINHAERIVLKIIQREAFPEGIAEQRIRSLNPILDENGLLRIKTRIFRRKDKMNFRLPVILPSKHRIVHMLIDSKHKDLGHSGVQILMNHLRENYWILQNRKTIRLVISRCMRCKRFTVTHREPKSTPLPEDRVREAKIFEIAGTDLAGPLYLRDGTKAWIVLYTCAVYRAVHIELITSLTAEAFLQALRRFIARRGRPTILYSDNGSNFVKAHSELSRLDWQKIETQTTLKKITWKFIPPSAPWWGGWWERLIGTMKQILRRILGQASLRYEELNTVLCDIESLINSRPLTYLSEDVDDLVALSPSMFLQETRECGVPDIDMVDIAHVRKRYLYLQRVREDLRKRFRQEYLGQLRHVRKCTKDSKAISVGEVVLIGSDNLKRLQWPIGRIIELLPGEDGIVRVVRIKTKSGILTRPVQRVYPLEIEEHVEGTVLRDKVLNHKNQESDVAVAQDEPGQEPKIMISRSGRVVKPPKKLDI